jgi:hypothetical protein
MARPAKKKTKKVVVVDPGVATFRASKEVEEFYKFTLENNLRDEARIMMANLLNYSKGGIKRADSKRVYQ